jgi:hypothetical protein
MMSRQRLEARPRGPETAPPEQGARRAKGWRRPPPPPPRPSQPAQRLRPRSCSCCSAWTTVRSRPPRSCSRRAPPQLPPMMSTPSAPRGPTWGPPSPPQQPGPPSPPPPLLLHRTWTPLRRRTWTPLRRRTCSPAHPKRPPPLPTRLRLRRLRSRPTRTATWSRPTWTPRRHPMRARRARRPPRPQSWLLLHPTWAQTMALPPPPTQTMPRRPTPPPPPPCSLPASWPTGTKLPPTPRRTMMQTTTTTTTTPRCRPAPQRARPSGRRPPSRPSPSTQTTTTQPRRHSARPTWTRGRRPPRTESPPPRTPHPLPQTPSPHPRRTATAPPTRSLEGEGARRPAGSRRVQGQGGQGPGRAAGQGSPQQTPRQTAQTETPRLQLPLRRTERVPWPVQEGAGPGRRRDGTEAGRRPASHPRASHYSPASPRPRSGRAGAQGRTRSLRPPRGAASCPPLPLPLPLLLMQPRPLFPSWEAEGRCEPRRRRCHAEEGGAPRQARRQRAGPGEGQGEETGRGRDPPPTTRGEAGRELSAGPEGAVARAPLPPLPSRSWEGATARPAPLARAWNAKAHLRAAKGPGPVRRVAAAARAATSSSSSSSHGEEEARGPRRRPRHRPGEAAAGQGPHHQQPPTAGAEGAPGCPREAAGEAPTFDFGTETGVLVLLLWRELAVAARTPRRSTAGDVSSARSRVMEERTRTEANERRQ